MTRKINWTSLISRYSIKLILESTFIGIGIFFLILTKFGASVLSNSPYFFSGDEITYANSFHNLFSSFGPTTKVFGYPGVQDLNYAGWSNGLGIFLFWIPLYALRQPFLILNLACLLSFGIAGATIYYCCRKLNLSKWIAAGAAVLISINFETINWVDQGFPMLMYFLAVPFMFLILRDFKSNQKLKPIEIVYLIFFGTTGSTWALGFGLIVGSFSLLYLIYSHNLNLFKSQLKKYLLILIGVFFTSIPAFINLFKVSGHPVYLSRYSWTSFASSGSLLQQISPTPGTLEFRFIHHFLPHILGNFSQFNDQFSQSQILSEGWVNRIPLLVLVGFFYILFRISVLKKERSQHIIVQVCMAIWILMWTWSGSLGTVFSTYAVPLLDGFARYAIFATFLIIISCAELLQADLSFVENRLKSRTQRIKPIFGKHKWIAVFIIGSGLIDVLLILPPARPANIKESTTQIQQVTSTLPSDCNVAEFPVIAYPFSGPGWPGYQLLLPGLLMNRTDVKWSAGAVEQSPAWIKLKDLQSLQDAEFSNLNSILKARGFCAIWVDPEVWNVWAKFKPTPDYQNSPKIDVNNFLTKFPEGRWVQFDNKRAYFSLLK